MREDAPVLLPEGFAVGHWTEPRACTGCTVVLAPEGVVAAGEVRGGGPGTRESDLLSPATAARSVQAVLLTGGSAFGLAAADGVARWLVARGRGYLTRPGILVPLVPAAVVYDLPLGDPEVRPGPEEGAAACEAARGEVARGSVGAGTGCTVGKLLGPDGWTKGGVGAAVERVGDATVVALAVVNAFGDVLAEDGSVLAGPWRDGGYVPSAQLLREGVVAGFGPREATTLACVITDARLDKVGAWLVARAGSAGVARAVDPAATGVDGDVVVCLASGRHEAEPLALQALAAHAVSAAIRDAVRSATGAPGCPSVAARG
ncbi:MAG: P1 family peptidase [Actinomycetota bacterium]|nr:P1 family peptidase [Actinomycetota bacterium]